MARFIAVVRKKISHQTPALNSAARPLLVGQDGKELPADPNNPGKYLGTGIQKIETTTTESTDDPLVDEMGNTIDAGTVDALLRRVKEHFGREENENVEVLKVTIQEVKSIQEVSGEELRKL